MILRKLKSNEKIKKRLYEILRSKILGDIVGFILRDRIPYYGSKIYTKSKLINHHTKTYLLLGIYEKQEYRLIKKYLNGKYDIIELGSSIGALSVTLGKAKNENSRLICVEVDSHLCELLRKNLINNNIKNYKIISQPVSGKKRKLKYLPGYDSTAGKINPHNDDQSNFLYSTTLSKILDDEDIAEYVLVCDIEGTEIDIMIHDKKAFKNCKQIIIELHETEFENRYYKINDYIEIFKKLGFFTIGKEGNSYAFQRQ